MKMKRLVALSLSAAMLLCLTSCAGNGKPGDEDSSKHTIVTTKRVYTWPDDALFGDVPALKDNPDTYLRHENDKGYTYEFGAKDMTYAQFREYLLKLENAGFKSYDVTGFGAKGVAEQLPEKLERGKNDASWIGFRRGFYVVAGWYSEKFYTEKKLPVDSSIKLTFYTYNPFE